MTTANQTVDVRDLLEAVAKQRDDAMSALALANARLTLMHRRLLELEKVAADQQEQQVGEMSKA